MKIYDATNLSRHVTLVTQRNKEQALLNLSKVQLKGYWTFMRSLEL